MEKEVPQKRVQARTNGKSASPMTIARYIAATIVLVAAIGLIFLGVMPHENREMILIATTVKVQSSGEELKIISGAVGSGESAVAVDSAGNSGAENSEIIGVLLPTNGGTDAEEDQNKIQPRVFLIEYKVFYGLLACLLFLLLDRSYLALQSALRSRKSWEENPPPSSSQERENGKEGKA